MVASRFSPVGSIVALTIFVSGIAVWKTNTKNDKPEIITLKPKRKKPRRLRRFADFASVEFNGQRFMTPQDFVDSMIHQNPRPRIKNKILTEAKVNECLNSTPLAQSDHHQGDFFGALKDKGIVSYAEYLFLLSLMTKSKADFRIPFSFIDVSKEGVISSDEYTRFTSLNVKKSGKSEESLQELHSNPEKTTLKVHFFGLTGERLLKFEEFSAFLCNFQREILEAEFQEYSQGQDKISFHDFLAMLIKYTKLSQAEIDDFHSRIPAEEGTLTFHQWQQFIKFLNALEDFSIAIGLYSMSGRSLTKDEFARAAKICLQGESLPSEITDLLFHLFLDEKVGQFHMEQFMVILKNRRNRRIHPERYPDDAWLEFKHCFRRTLRNHRL